MTRQEVIRDFAKVAPFKFDADGDKTADTITPRLLKVKMAGKKRSKIRETH